jgi:membrane associated rhomboid family serine protease
MWILEIIDVLILGQNLNQYGIVPRNITGLRGLVFAPFLHANFSHLAANTLPFLVLGGLIAFQSIKHFYLIFCFGALMGGGLVWIFGANAMHIGASGVIFTFFGYLCLKGFYEKRFISIVISILVAVFYGGMIYGVMPNQEGVSWEGHFFGLVVGSVMAKFISK